MKQALSRSAKGKLQRIAGQPSWVLRSDTIELFITRLGGHMAPVVFDRNGARFSPFHIAPWAQDQRVLRGRYPPILKVLRGDFFCMPFGGNETPFRGERHPPHGVTANAPWSFQSLRSSEGCHELRLALNSRIRRGRVTRTVLLRDGEDGVYCRHELALRGAMNFGHHPTLRFPDQPGSGLISTSPILFGIVNGALESPEKGGYSLLMPGATFESIQKVPTITGGFADLSVYPARRGFEDLATLVSDPSVALGWTAVVFPRQRFVWFSLKDPRVLRQTVFWFSNGGRHYPPWNGAHVNVMGLEEVTSWHAGLAESVRTNPISQRGIPTHADLKQSLNVNLIFVAVPVPARFDHVERIEAEGDSVVLISRSGKRARARVDSRWLQLTPAKAFR